MTEARCLTVAVVCTAATIAVYVAGRGVLVAAVFLALVAAFVCNLREERADRRRQSITYQQGKPT